MKILNSLILPLFCFAACSCSAKANSSSNESANEPEITETTIANAGDIVGTDHQKYSYNEMIQDLEQLQKQYPECVSFELKDATDQGRQIPLVYFGKKNAAKKIMITASIHSREYMTAQLVMAMLEDYAKNYNSGSYNNVSYSSLFSNVCLVIMPMVNPDGVEIAQNGVNGAKTKEAKDWVASELKKGQKADQIKSNARGIDLNRNFTYGFGHDPRRVGRKGFDHYNGTAAYSEIETRLMKTIADMYTYEFFLNYHTHGNLLYYGCKDAKLKDVNAEALKVARLVSSVTGYQPKAEVDPAYGSWADEVENRYHRASVTIEVGSRNPVPIAEFNGIYKKNKNVWAKLALAIYNNQL